MRASVLSTAAAAAALSAAGPASASDITMGRSLASACYDASMAPITPRFALFECNRAIEDELLTSEDRAATFVNRGILRMKARDDRGADDDFDMALGMTATPKPCLTRASCAFAKAGIGRPCRSLTAPSRRRRSGQPWPITRGP